MSTETLKFFEDKTTEEIINWMLSNLTEDQIRSCLDQSGIPDTSVIKKESIAAAAAGSGTIQTTTLSDGTEKQSQSGEGSSTDRSVRAQLDAGKLFLNKYRKKCSGTGYLIKSVTKEGVEYYEFKEIEEKEISVTPDTNLGDVGWVKKFVPLSKFVKNSCTEEDREIFEILKEENKETFLNVPAEVIEVANDYQSSGLVSPIPINIPQIDIASEPTPVIATSDEVQITEVMLKAIRIQQASSQLMSTSYPNLYSVGLKMYPIFIYASDENLVLHLSTVVRDGKLTFIKDSTNSKLLNSKFKKITSAIQSAVQAGMYTPTDDIQKELNDALKSISQDITKRISKIYDPIILDNYTYFGSLEDEEIFPDSQESFDEVGPQDFDEDTGLVPELEDQSSPIEKFNMINFSDTSNVVSSNKKKRVSDMTIPEIEEHMRIQFGEQYVRDYKPEKYVNSLGVTNVRYVKRTKCPCEDEPVMVSRPIFTEFQGKRSVNSGPGLFGESDSDDLLFD